MFMASNGIYEPFWISIEFRSLAYTLLSTSISFADDIEMMTGSRPALYWMICWKYISPAAMITILVASFMELASSGSNYPAWVAAKGVTELREWPHWCIVLAVFLILVSVIWIPVIAIARYDWFEAYNVSNSKVMVLIQWLVLFQTFGCSTHWRHGVCMVSRKRATRYIWNCTTRTNANWTYTVLYSARWFRRFLLSNIHITWRGITGRGVIT